MRDPSDLAAADALGLAQNHPLRDGNKRVAFLAAGLFLELNGLELVPRQVAAVQAFFAPANGKLTEKQLAKWIRRNSSRIDGAER
jgi:death-on-curing protein